MLQSLKLFPFIKEKDETMKLLEYFYERNNDLGFFHQRKFNIPNDDKVHIYGSPGGGKSFLVLDYMMTFNTQEILYIDFNDPKLYFIHISVEELNRFIVENKIKILILDHYEHSYFKRLPSSNRLIIVSDIMNDYDEDFQTLEVPLLDYEEFFSFQKKGNETQIFNLFFKQGTLPALAVTHYLKEEVFQNFLKNHFSESEIKLLCVLAYFNGKTVTTFQLYTYAKERYKISKDQIYKQIKQFQTQKVIHFIEDTLNLTTKKLLFYDFALAKHLSLNQSFFIQFDTMLALSLIKHNIHFKTFGQSAYLTEKNILIYPAPFENEENFLKKAYNRLSHFQQANIVKISIVTINTHYKFKIENIEFEALPFYEWVVINDEN